MEVDGRKSLDSVQDGLSRIGHEAACAVVHGYAIAVSCSVRRAHDAHAIGVPTLLGDDLLVAAEAAGCEHHRLRAVPHHALTSVCVGADHPAVLHDEAVHCGFEMQLHAQLFEPRLHRLNVSHSRLSVFEPVERGE